MTMDVLLVWLEFAVCAALIGMAGATLSRNADVIADKTGFSRGWINLSLFTLYLLNTYVLYLHGD